MPQANTLVALLSLFAIACATSGSGGGKKKKGKAFEVEQPFPSEKQVDKLLQQPAAKAAAVLGQVPANAQQWTLAEGLPADAGAIPFDGTDPVRKKAASVIEKAKAGFEATNGMMCYAQEYARFIAAHDDHPPSDIRTFIGGRCGTLVRFPTVNTGAPTQGLSAGAAGQAPRSDHARVRDRAQGQHGRSRLGGGWR